MFTRGIGRKRHAASKEWRAAALLGALTTVGIAVNALIILADHYL